MGQDLLKRREQVMEQANRALDAAWPERKGEEFVRQSRRAVRVQTAAHRLRGIVLKTHEFQIGSTYGDKHPAAIRNRGGIGRIGDKLCPIGMQLVDVQTAAIANSRHAIALEAASA